MNELNKELVIPVFVATILLLVVAPVGVTLAKQNSTAVPDCRIPGSNPPHYNTTCEGINTKQFNNTVSIFENISKNIIGNITK